MYILSHVQAGGTVRFYHRKRNCYVVAEGSFAGRFAKLSGHEDDHTESGRLLHSYSRGKIVPRN